jgi:cell division protein FtsZ
MPAITDLNSFAPTSASAAMSKVGLEASSASFASPDLGNANSLGNPNASGAMGSAGRGVDYGDLDRPSVFRNARAGGAAPTLGADSSPQAKTMLDKGTDYYEIPAFLRKQAD